MYAYEASNSAGCAPAGVSPCPACMHLFPFIPLPPRPDEEQLFLCTEIRSGIDSFFTATEQHGFRCFSVKIHHKNHLNSE